MFIRKCPECNKDIKYSLKKSYNLGNKKESLCRSCALKNRDKICYEKISNKLKGKEKSKEHKEKLSIANLGKKLSDEHKKKISIGLLKNGNVNKKSNYDCWVEKYGEEIAKIKLNKKKERSSIASTGKNNPMYGKPSPQGSGNGWSGWYKGFYFRSLKELSYIYILFKNNVKFLSAEKKEYKIEYYDPYKKQNRNYFPDFYLIETQEIIEIKPKRTIKFHNNKIKFDAAKKKLGDKFKIISDDDYEQLSFIKIKEMYFNKEIIFLDKYEQKIKEKINENNKS